MFQRLLALLMRHKGRVLAYLTVAIVACVVLAAHERPKSKPLPTQLYSQLMTKMQADKVAKLTWDPNTLTVRVVDRDAPKRPYEVAVPAVNGPEGLQLLLKEAREAVEVKAISISDSGEPLLLRLLAFLPTLLLFAVLLVVGRGMIPGTGRRIEPVTTDVTFDDVAGCQEAIEELRDVRSFLRDPNRYAKLGAKVPKGVLLHGPPGTGKTLLAKAVANEAGCPFYETSGSEFVEMFAGLGARRVRQQFKAAKRNAPAIIFIDELDAIGSKRSEGGDGGSREENQTLLQLLKEMDGFSSSPDSSLKQTWRKLTGKPVPVQHPVIVMGATNRRSSLDNALLRPGRFDRHIAIDPPDRGGRRDVLAVHAVDKPLAADVELDDMALHSAGFSGAELAQWLNEAALIAARREHAEISAADVDDAFFRIVAGPRKQHRTLSSDERHRVAVHEAGHALVGETLNSTERVHKISIIPRGESGGQTINVSEEDVFLYREQTLHDQIAMLLAGRAAEELVFGERTSGAHDDLLRATALARKMITQLGMGETLGLRVAEADFAPSSGVQAQVDDEIRRVLAQEFTRAMALLTDQQAALTRVSDTLLEEETLDRERFLELLA